MKYCVAELRLTVELILPCQPWIVILVGWLELKFELSNEFKSSRKILWPTVGFWRVYKRKITSAAALKKGSTETSIGFKSTKCMRPSASGTRVQRCVASVFEISTGRGDADATVNDHRTKSFKIWFFNSQVAIHKKDNDTISFIFAIKLKVLRACSRFKAGKSLALSSSTW